MANRSMVFRDLLVQWSRDARKQNWPAIVIVADEVERDQVQSELDSLVGEFPPWFRNRIPGHWHEYILVTPYPRVFVNLNNPSHRVYVSSAVPESRLSQFAFLMLSNTLTFFDGAHFET